MSDYKVSLVIPAYNAEGTLVETIEAALRQDFNSYQIVIVDDGSKDTTLNIALAYQQKHSHIKVLSQENKGTGGAYNTGVKNADGSWISICSADDLLYPHALSSLWAAHEAHSEFKIIVSNGNYLYEDGKTTPVYQPSARRNQEVLFETVLKRCFYGVGALYEKQVFNQVGGYAENLFVEDYDFWLRAMMAGFRVYYVNEILSAHRISDAQKTANSARAHETAIAVYEKCIESGLLSDELTQIARDSAQSRKEALKNLSDKKPNAVKQRIVRVLVDLFGRDRLERLIHLVKGKP